MQRLFFMFAGGAAGLALLILRVCGAGSILIYAATHGSCSSPSWPVLGIGAILILIITGFITPIACAVAALTEIYYLRNASGADQWPMVFTLLVFVALGLLGPGAYSVDAKLFGRRLIVPDED
jgi:hypothetical protein